MPITENQLELRRKHIGSSDMAAILGQSPWRTAYDVWLEKTGQLPAKVSDESEAMGIGKMVENSLLDWGALQIGRRILKNQFRVHVGGILSATHDALVPGEPTGLEAKTAGIISPWTARDKWGEADTDEVPDYYILQIMHQMVVSGLARVYMPALIGGRGRVLFRIEFNQELADNILYTAERFWHDHVEKQVPPSDSLPSIEFAKARRRIAGKIVPLDDGLLTRWQLASGVRKQAEAAEELAQREIMAALGDAEAGDGAVQRVRIVRGESKWVDQALLAAKHPAVLAEAQRSKPFAYARLVNKPKEVTSERSVEQVGSGCS